MSVGNVSTPFVDSKSFTSEEPRHKTRSQPRRFDQDRAVEDGEHAGDDCVQACAAGPPGRRHAGPRWTGDLDLVS